MSTNIFGFGKNYIIITKGETPGITCCPHRALRDLLNLYLGDYQRKRGL